MHSPTHRLVVETTVLAAQIIWDMLMAVLLGVKVHL